MRYALDRHTFDSDAVIELRRETIMPANRYARIDVKIVRDEVVVSGQRQTRRGQYYNKDTVRKPLATHTGAAFKKAAEAAVLELLESSE